jgi:hypothetical protein
MSKGKSTEYIELVALTDQVLSVSYKEIRKRLDDD